MFFRQTLSDGFGPRPWSLMTTTSDATVQAQKQQKTQRLSPSSVVYWSRLGFAVLASVVYTALGLGREGVVLGTLNAIALGFLFYVASVLVVKHVWKYGPAELAGPRKHVTLGMGSYIIWLIFMLTLLNTLLYYLP